METGFIKKILINFDIRDDEWKIEQCLIKLSFKTLKKHFSIKIYPVIAISIYLIHLWVKDIIGSNTFSNK